MLVAPAALAALGADEGLVRGEVRHHRAAFGLFDDGAPGHADHQILALFAGLAAAGSVRAVFGGVFALVAEVGQGGQVVVRNEDDIAALAAVAAVRPAGGDVFFAVERHGPVAAVARFDFDIGRIYKHNGLRFSCDIDIHCRLYHTFLKI